MNLSWSLDNQVSAKLRYWFVAISVEHSTRTDQFRVQFQFPFVFNSTVVIGFDVMLGANSSSGYIEDERDAFYEKGVNNDQGMLM